MRCFLIPHLPFKKHLRATRWYKLQHVTLRRQSMYPPHLGVVDVGLSIVQQLRMQSKSPRQYCAYSYFPHSCRSSARYHRLFLISQPEFGVTCAESRRVLLTAIPEHLVGQVQLVSGSCELLAPPKEIVLDLPIAHFPRQRQEIDRNCSGREIQKHLQVFVSVG